MFDGCGEPITYELFNFNKTSSLKIIVYMSLQLLLHISMINMNYFFLYFFLLNCSLIFYLSLCVLNTFVEYLRSKSASLSIFLSRFFS